MDEMFVRKTRGEKIKGGEANERISLERFREQSDGRVLVLNI